MATAFRRSFAPPCSFLLLVLVRRTLTTIATNTTTNAHTAMKHKSLRSIPFSFQPTFRPTSVLHSHNKSQTTNYPQFRIDSCQPLSILLPNRTPLQRTKQLNSSSIHKRYNLFDYDLLSVYISLLGCTNRNQDTSSPRIECISNKQNKHHLLHHLLETSLTRNKKFCLK